MDLTLIEKIIANHSGNEVVKPGEIVDIEIDVRAARDFGGANPTTLFALLMITERHKP